MVKTSEAKHQNDEKYSIMLNNIKDIKNLIFYQEE